ncbi:MAG: hypothetical protein PHW90_03195 [Bacilli bacterium]|nr:hypothetical protein [Bacilli bacterium]
MNSMQVKDKIRNISNNKNLSYEDVINCLEDLIKIIEPVTV